MPRAAPRMAAPLAEYKDRLARTRAYMQRADLDLLLIYQPEQYNWLSGYEPTSTFFYQVLIVPCAQQPVTLMCNKAELALCDETCWVDDVRVLWTYEDQVARTLDVLRERNLLDGVGRLGLSLSSYYLKPRHAFELRAAIPGVEFVDTDPALDHLRLVKSETEIDHLRRAAHIADLGVVAGINAIHEGVTDRDAMGRGSVCRRRERGPVPGLSRPGRRSGHAARHADRAHPGTRRRDLSRGRRRCSSPPLPLQHLALGRDRPAERRHRAHVRRRARGA